MKLILYAAPPKQNCGGIPHKGGRFDLNSDYKGLTSKMRTMLEIDFGNVPRETKLGAGVIIKSCVHKQLIQLPVLLPRSPGALSEFHCGYM